MAVVHFEGNIFDSEAPVIGHGVNLQGAMDSGIAAQVKELYPSVYESYKQVCEFDSLAAGTSLVLQVTEEESDTPRWIANIASQVQPGANADLKLLEDGLYDTIEQMRDMGLFHLALPRIGAGIGGLDWDLVLDAIESEAEVNPDFTVEVWTYNE